MENTSKNFVLQLGALVSLYASLGAAIAIAFGIINIIFPDAAEYYWEYESAQSGVRFGIATLIVFFPTYLVLTRMVNQIRRKEHGVYLTLTRWLIYLSLFLGGAILLGDLVAVIWSFLNGEITTRFLLKAAVLLIVIGAALKYYILDARGYWNTHEKQSRLYGAIAGSAAIAIIAAGFSHIDAPSEVREFRLDEQQVTDLMDMQYRIEEHYRVNGTLPDGLDEVYADGSAPLPPEDRAAYEYRVTGERNYELCATFERSTMRDGRSMVRVYEPYAGNYNWEHGEGRTCFERIVEPMPAL